MACSQYQAKEWVLYRARALYVPALECNRGMHKLACTVRQAWMNEYIIWFPTLNIESVGACYTPPCNQLWLPCVLPWAVSGCRIPPGLIRKEDYRKAKAPFSNASFESTKYHQANQDQLDLGAVVKLYSTLVPEPRIRAESGPPIWCVLRCKNLDGAPCQPH